MAANTAILVKSRIIYFIVQIVSDVAIASAVSVCATNHFISSIKNILETNMKKRRLS